MRIPILTFGAIASILIINSVLADTTVTSKQYVDTTRQATIPAAGTNYDENGGGVSVVTYTEDGAGILGERFICDADAEENGDCDADNLVTRDLLSEATYLPTTTVTTKTCYQEVNGDCILWELSEKRVLGQSCSPDRRCPSGYCCGGDGICFNGPGCML